MSDTWPPPQGQPSWPPPQNVAPQKTVEHRLVEWSIPINRSGLAIAAGYVALFTLPVLFVAPVAVLLGVLAMADLSSHPEKLGKGRAWFAIIYGGLGTVALIILVGARVISGL